METVLRYVVLRHDGIAIPHYDFMCEWRRDSPLMTLRFAEWPPVGDQSFERLGDHRREYLTYEGPVSNGRGFVKRVAQGSCSIKVDSEESCLIVLDNGMEIRVERAAWD